MIFLQLTKFTKMNVWVYYLYWSNKYPVGPDDPVCRVATIKRNQTEIINVLTYDNETKNTNLPVLK